MVFCKNVAYIRDESLEKDRNRLKLKNKMPSNIYHSSMSMVILNCQNIAYFRDDSWERGKPC